MTTPTLPTLPEAAPPADPVAATGAPVVAAMTGAKNVVGKSTKLWDLNGDGVLDDTEKELRARAKELGLNSHKDMLYDLMQNNVQLMREHGDLLKNYLNLKKLVVFMGSLVVIIALTSLGTSFAAAILAKDTQVQGSALLTKNNEAVTTGINEAVVVLGSLAFLPPDVVRNVRTVAFAGPGGYEYTKTVRSTKRKPKESIVISTTEGDTLTWSVQDKANVAIVLEDGTSWKRDVLCDECTMTNVLETEGVKAALEEFEDAVVGGDAHNEEVEGEASRRGLKGLMSSRPSRASRRRLNGACGITKNPVIVVPAPAPAPGTSSEEVGGATVTETEGGQGQGNAAETFNDIAVIDTAGSQGQGQGITGGENINGTSVTETAESQSQAENVFSPVVDGIGTP